MTVRLIRARMEKILVIGDDLRSFLAIVRSLGRAGYEVHAAPFDFSSPALVSRYISAIHRLPGYSASPDAWLARLDALIAQHKFALIIPCGDNALLPLAHHREVLTAPVALPNDPALGVFFDKAKTRALAAQYGVPVAKGGPVSAALVADLGLPVALKPRSSVKLQDVGKRCTVKIIRSDDEVETGLRDAVPSDDYFLEAFFPGEGVGVSVLARHGEIMQAFQHRRLAETSEAGGSSSRISEPLDAALLSAVTKMCAATQYHGVAMFEFRHNRLTGAFILLEVNARFWGSLPLAIASGIDFPAALATMLLTGACAPRHAYRSNVVRRHLTAEYYRILHESEQAAGSVSRNLGRLLRLVRLALNVMASPYQFDSYARDDLAPFRAELRRMKTHFMRSAAQRLPENRQALMNQSRSALGDLLPAAPRVPRLTIICLGNICRSPFAARLLAARLGDTAIVTSAGTLLLPDRPSPTDAISAARDHDISLQDHRSRSIDLDEIEESDAILIFDDRNADDLAQFGVNPAKIIRLGNLIGRRTIEDPYARGLGAFVTCYEQIEAAVDIVAAAVRAR